MLSSMRGGFLTSALEKYLKLDMAKYVQWIADLGLFPRVLNVDFSALFLQNMFGTVTIIPRFSFWAVVNLVSDPTKERMGWYILEGERAAWPKIELIRSTFALERTINLAYAAVKREASEKKVSTASV